MNRQSPIRKTESCHSLSRRSLRRRGVLSVLACLACIALSLPSSHALEIEPLWVKGADMVMEGAASVVDLNGDGDAEILTAAYENMIVFDGNGEEFWRFDTRGRYSTQPAILERKGDSPLIYAGDNRGLFTCLDGAGQVVWQVDMNPVFCSVPALADLDGDGRVEVVQGDKSGTVNVFDALSGDVVWKKKIEGECASPAVGDLDGDGTMEIVITTGAGKVFALDASSDVLWEFSVGGTSPDWSTSSPVLFGNSAGDVCVAAASQQGRFFCLDRQGNVLWERATRGSISSTLSAGDFDADGRADLFVATQLGVLYRFDEDGRVLWDIDTQGRCLASGALVDLDGNGTLEYVLCTQRGNLLAFDQAGEIVVNHQFGSRTINMTLAFGDIVKKRRGLEFAVTGGESGQMFCFGLPAPVDTAAPWRTYRGDNRLTGAWFGLASSETVLMTPENLSWDSLVTGSDVTFRIVNPTPSDAALKAQASCVRPDGSRQTAVGKVIGERGLLKMPVSITAPGAYRFEWVLADSTGAQLADGSRELTLQPYVNDQALALRATLGLREAIALGGPTVPKADRGLRAALNREAQAIEEETGSLALLQTAMPGAPPAFSEKLNARTAALNARAERALALGTVARSILTEAPKSQVVAFEGITWENEGVDKQLPTELKIPLRIERVSVPDEHEPVSIKLLNVTLETVKVGARVETDADGPKVTLFEVKSVPTNQNEIAWDPIEPLNGGKLSIPTLETREVWLDIDLAGVKPGTYPIQARFGTGASEAKVEISVKVLPFEMAGPDTMRLCCWASYNEDAVRDLLEHGNNVFVTSLPPATVGKGDTPEIELDFSGLDQYVAPLMGHDVFLLMSGIPSLGVPMEEEAYVPRLAKYLDRLMSHLASKGIAEERVALYPHDEPGGHGWDTVNHYIAFGRQGLKAHPGLKLYVNGGGDLAMFEALNEVAAIWCPGYYMLAEKSPQMTFLRESGKTLWTYDCGYAFARPYGANTKIINIVAQFRLSSVYALYYGATGIGYWCYNVGPSMWDTIVLEYPLVYVNEDKTHTSSRRWEAVRESMEDTRILAALREKLEDASVGAAVKKKIRHLLEETLGALTIPTFEEARLGVADYMLDASHDDGTVENLRQEMMECVALLAEG